jgi:hypothetical protein
MTSDSVLALDRFQNSDQRHSCQADPRHGTLVAHAGGAHLVCGRKGCEYSEPVSADLLRSALELK